MNIRFRGEVHEVEIVGIDITTGSDLVVRRLSDSKIFRIPLGGAPADLVKPPEPVAQPGI